MCFEKWRHPSDKPPSAWCARARTHTHRLGASVKSRSEGVRPVLATAWHQTDPRYPLTMLTLGINTWTPETGCGVGAGVRPRAHQCVWFVRVCLCFQVTGGGVEGRHLLLLRHNAESHESSLRSLASMYDACTHTHTPTDIDVVMSVTMISKPSTTPVVQQHVWSHCFETSAPHFKFYFFWIVQNLTILGFGIRIVCRSGGLCCQGLKNLKHINLNIEK